MTLGTWDQLCVCGYTLLTSSRTGLPQPDGDVSPPGVTATPPRPQRWGAGISHLGRGLAVKYMAMEQTLRSRRSPCRKLILSKFIRNPTTYLRYEVIGRPFIFMVPSAQRPAQMGEWALGTSDHRSCHRCPFMNRRVWLPK